MREIKFRTWDVQNKQMLKSHELNYSFLEANDFRWFIPMQYTGLKDKNGKEIYEGDILKDDDILAVVEWDNNLARFYSVKPTVRAWVNCEVLGNIYKSPEILGIKINK